MTIRISKNILFIAVLTFLVPPRVRRAERLGDQRCVRPGRGAPGHAATAGARHAPTLSNQRKGNLGRVHTGEVFQWISIQLPFKNQFLTYN